MKACFNSYKGLIMVFLLAAQLPGFAQPLIATFDHDGGQRTSISHARPLQELLIVDGTNHEITVRDGAGRVYYTATGNNATSFTVAGSLGKHTVTLKDRKGNTTQLSFDVTTETRIDDGGKYADMFNLFYTSMQTDTGSVNWNGRRYRYFVPWGLDHCHTMKGLKYFYDFGGEFLDLMRQAQRPDGMIYSFVEHMPNMDYFRTRDAWSGYTQKIGDKYFVRQPTENHPEYIFVKSVYQWWKASGDDAWMKKQLASAAAALDYQVTDPARWSTRFQLLKRVYTIDSWDFQVDDEYTPNLGLTNTMVIDPVKSKFGIFFGDNTSFSMACRQLSEMYARAGENELAAKYQERAQQIDSRLNALSWNGKFFTHFIDEDPTVNRNLGVDEKTQLAQSNAYSLNRGISHEKSKAIIESYLDLRNHLPVGSPGEWYAIYPPFGRGFDMHGTRWQYMNGGVGGHVAGELARGAFENGYETYGIDILDRLYSLGKKYNNKIYFSYTGSIPPPPPPPVLTTINLGKVANMDIQTIGGKDALPWMNSKREGDDLNNLPVGIQHLKKIAFDITDPFRNNRKSAVAVSNQKNFPSRVEIPVNKKAGAIYLLHTASKPSSENIAAAMEIVYADGTKTTQYLVMEKHLTYWWFSNLKTDRSGIAWYGENKVSKGVGVSWCAIDTNPEKEISKIVFNAAADATIYTLLGLTLSDAPHYIPVNPVSYGGPDNWAAATAMAALIEGLAGVKDSPASEAYDKPVIAPRWTMTSTKKIDVTVLYPVSKGYVAYELRHDESKKEIEIHVTGSGDKLHFHFPIPVGSVKSLTAASAIPFTTTQVESTTYVDFEVNPLSRDVIRIRY